MGDHRLQSAPHGCASSGRISCRTSKATSSVPAGEHRRPGPTGLRRRTRRRAGVRSPNFARGEVVEVRVGTSFLSGSGGAATPRTSPGLNFGMRCAGSCIPRGRERTGPSRMGRRQRSGKNGLYTALYHSLLYPRVFSEYGHYYSAFDDQVHTGESYTAFRSSGTRSAPRTVRSRCWLRNAWAG